MDELELLKKDWKRQEKSLPHVKKDEIRVMMHKKSTSIVKWIFIISIAEFLFWIAVEFFSLFGDSQEVYEQLGMSVFFKVLVYINYIFILVFISLFFINYRKIKTNDSIKDLIKNIIRTRRTVKTYVWVNVIMVIVASVILFYEFYSQEIAEESLKLKLIMAGVFIGILVVMVLLLLGFYRLLYGILTRRLKRNYQALKKLEMKE